MLGRISLVRLVLPTASRRFVQDLVVDKYLISDRFEI